MKDDTEGKLEGALVYLRDDHERLVKAGQDLEADADVIHHLRASLDHAARTALGLVALLEEREPMLSADERGFLEFARPAAERWQELAARKGDR